jgi:hypothetical protein
MDIDKYEMGFFNEQIVTAVASLGFEQPDVKFTNDSLYTVFSNRCSLPTAVIPPDAGPQLQSICVAGNCPLDVNATCGAYPGGGFVEQPAVANTTLVGNVTKENETEAAPTAKWPVHCLAARDVSGTQTCSFAGGAATSTTAANGATAIRKDLDIAAQLAVAWVVVASCSGILFLV